MDPVFMIREQASDTIIKLSKTIYDREWLERTVDLKLEEFARNERFMLRIQTVHLINQLKEHIDPESQDQLFTEHLLKLAEDPVPNIRFNVSKCIANVYPNMSA